MVWSALVLALCTGFAGAADDSNARPPQPTAPPAMSADHLDAVVPDPRQGLLREGSHLLHAHGRMHHDEDANEWRFTIDSASEHAPRFVLTVVPNSYLGEVQQIIAATTEQDVVLDVSGQVLVYQRRNYLLLTHPPRVVGHGAAEDAEGPDSEAPDAEPTDEQADAPRDAGSIMRDLQRETGPVQRRSSPGVRPRSESLVREGQAVVMRRGKVIRDAGGAWVFVFDADASGQADPPMTLLPCLLLERIANQVQRRGSMPVLISGQVFLHEDRNYLLPSVYQVPRERDSLTP